jgi:hypothetical protein
MITWAHDEWTLEDRRNEIALGLVRSELRERHRREVDGKPKIVYERLTLENYIAVRMAEHIIHQDLCLAYGAELVEEALCQDYMDRIAGQMRPLPPARRALGCFDMEIPYAGPRRSHWARTFAARGEVHR